MTEREVIERINEELYQWACENGNEDRPIEVCQDGANYAIKQAGETIAVCASLWWLLASSVLDSADLITGYRAR